MRLITQDDARCPVELVFGSTSRLSLLKEGLSSWMGHNRVINLRMPLYSG